MYTQSKNLENTNNLKTPAPEADGIKLSFLWAYMFAFFTYFYFDILEITENMIPCTLKK